MGHMDLPRERKKIIVGNMVLTQVSIIRYTIIYLCCVLCLSFIRILPDSCLKKRFERFLYEKVLLVFIVILL